MNLSQIQAFEPGDAQWGVKLDDVRGQAEAKEEVRRVVSIWQSGENFERAGGKRERGVLFLGQPGTGKTMLAKALATGFNSPFVSIPGSGFAATFIGIDAIVVRILARRAKKLARKWGGQCIVFIDEIDAVGMRRQTLGQGAPGGAATPLQHDDPQDLLFFGPWGARNPSGDLVLETRALAREDVRRPRRRRPSALAPCRRGCRASRTSCSRAAWADGRRARAQPAARRHGRHRQPAVLQEALDEQAQQLPRRHLRRAAAHRPLLAAPARREAAQGADLLHRRDERPDRAARPGAHPPGPHGPPRLVPDADEAGPPRHPRPLHRQGLALRRPRPARAARRDRADHERLLAGDDRAGDLDGADDRAPLRTATRSTGRTSSSRSRRSSRGRRSGSSTSRRRAARSRCTRRATRSPVTPT